MFRSAFYTVWGGLQYARLLVSTDKNAHGKYGDFPPPSTTHAVLIIPGWLGPGSVGDAFAAMFAHKGVPACTFHIGFHAVKHYRHILRMLYEHVVKLRAACPNLQRLDIVAHSMGGVMAVEMIMDGVLDGLTVQLVTLGSMHLGTWRALIGCAFSLSAWELLPIRRRFRTSVTYGRLHQVPFLSIAGVHDLIVPPECSKHPLATFQSAKADHGTLLFQRRIFRMVHRFFQESRTLAPLGSA